MDTDASTARARRVGDEAPPRLLPVLVAAPPAEEDAAAPQPFPGLELDAPARHPAVLDAVWDTLALVVAALLAAATIAVVHHGTGLGPNPVQLSGILLRLLATVPILALGLSTARTRWSLHPTPGRVVYAVAPALAAGGLTALTLWAVASGVGIVPHPVTTNALLLLCAFGLGTVTAARVATHAMPWRATHRPRRVVIVGSGMVAGRVASQLRSTDGIEVVGFVDDDPLDPAGWCGRLPDLATVVQRRAVDHVVVAFSRSSTEDILEAIRPVQGRVPITVVPRLFDVLPASAAVHDIGSGLTGISVAPAALSRGARLAKRTIDVAGAAGALLVLSPLLALVALAIKLTSPGPVLFRQDRIGRNGEQFAIVKFRSMVTDAEQVGGADGVAAVGPFPKLKEDPRVTRVGRFIRSTSIDELPQLLNVLRGDMSLVGPRPFVPDESATIAGWAQRRYRVRPGITGLWQVSGRNDLTFDEMCRLDSMYVSSWCIALDLKILVRTLRAVASRSGAY